MGYDLGDAQETAMACLASNEAILDLRQTELQKQQLLWRQRVEGSENRQAALEKVGNRVHNVRSIMSGP